MSYIRIENLWFSYNSVDVIRGISYGMGRTEWVLMIGPNGVGKSTLLKLIIGLLSPSSGVVEIDHRSISQISEKERAKLLGYLPQTVSWVFPYTVQEIVSMGLYRRFRGFGLNRYTKLTHKIKEVLSLMGLQNLAMRRIDELSAGERQLVYLARVLAQEPQFFLFDEPMTNLDMNHKRKFWEIIKLLKSQNKGGIIVSHEILFPVGLFDYVICIKRGKVFASGTPEEIINTKGLELLYGTPMNVVKKETYIAFPSLQKHRVAE